MMAFCLAGPWWRPHGGSERPARRQANGSLPDPQQPFSAPLLWPVALTSALPGAKLLVPEPEPAPEVGSTFSAPAAPQAAPATSPPPPEPVPVPPRRTATFPGLDYTPPATVEGLEKEAFTVAFRLLKEFPNHTDPLGLMGMLHNNLGSAAKAMEFWQRCLKRNPNRPDIYQAMGRLVLTQEKYQDAVDFSQRALEISPKQSGARTILAQALMGLGKPQEAIAALRDEIRVSPGPNHNDWLSGDYCLAARAYQQLAEYEKASQNFQKAIQMQPDCTEAYYGLATVCARLGESDKARRYMAKFKTLKDQDRAADMGRRRHATDIDWVRRIVARTHTDAGRVYSGHRKLRKAEEHWQKAAKLDPKNAACRRDLALLYERSGRDREALEICKQLREIDPKNAQYHLNLGVLYARMNKIGAALVSVRRAMKLDPDNAQHRRIYEQIRNSK